MASSSHKTRRLTRSPVLAIGFPLSDTSNPRFQTICPHPGRESLIRATRNPNSSIKNREPGGWETQTCLPRQLILSSDDPNSQQSSPWGNENGKNGQKPALIPSWLITCRLS